MGKLMRKEKLKIAERVCGARRNMTLLRTTQSCCMLPVPHAAFEIEVVIGFFGRNSQKRAIYDRIIDYTNSFFECKLYISPLFECRLWVTSAGYLLSYYARWAVPIADNPIGGNKLTISLSRSVCSIPLSLDSYLYNLERDEDGNLGTVHCLIVLFGNFRVVLRLDWPFHHILFYSILFYFYD